MQSPFDALTARLAGPDPAAAIRQGLIGEDALIDTPFGQRQLIYADYVASGRALAQVEDTIRETVLPYYANTHSDSSHVGAFMTRVREESRALIGRLIGADAAHAVLFSGSGATAGLNQLVALLDLRALRAAGQRVVVLIGPYEHHSNLLPWRESGAEVREIPEGADGGPDLAVLEAQLNEVTGAVLRIGAFSAASNVTGTLTDTDSVTALLHRHGALAVWDYACAAPYGPVSLGFGQAQKDALVFSAHKFVGGPGASGVLVVRRSAIARVTPTRPGGGTVAFVSPWAHRFSPDLIEREEGGTPNILGDIRAGLAMLVTSRVDPDWMAARHEDLRQRALAVWRRTPGLTVLGHDRGHRALPIFSLVFSDAAGAPVEPGAVSRALSDRYGLQTRAGCSCAGPYGHRLLGIDLEASHHLMRRIDRGEAVRRPGWVRLNLSPFFADDKAQQVIRSVADFARLIASGAPVLAAEDGTSGPAATSRAAG